MILGNRKKLPRAYPLLSLICTILITNPSLALFGQGDIPSQIIPTMPAAGAGAGSNAPALVDGATGGSSLSGTIAVDPIQVGDIHSFNQIDIGADLNAQMNSYQRVLGDTNNAIAGVSQQWQGTNNFLGILSNPVQLALLAASAGTGFVIGSAIANIAVSAAKAGCDALYHFLHERITHKKENEELIVAFNKATKEYEKTMRLALDLEAVLDNLIEIQENLSQHGLTYSKSETIAAINSYISFVKLAIRKNSELRELEYSSLGDRNDRYIALDVLVKKNKSFKESLKKAKKAVNDSHNDDLCGGIWRFYNDLVIIEGNLSSFRTDLLAAKKEWFIRFHKEARKQDRNIDRILDDAEQIYHNEKKEAVKTANLHRKHLLSDRKRYITSCDKQYRDKRQSLSELKVKLIHLSSQNPQMSGVNTRPNWLQRIFYRKTFYRQQICGIEYQLFMDPTQKEESFTSSQLVAIDKSEQQIMEIMKYSMHQTLSFAHYLRVSPEQNAALIIANLLKNFDNIAMDQYLYSRQNYANQARQVTHASKRRAQIETVCKSQGHQENWTYPDLVDT